MRGIFKPITTFLRLEAAGGLFLMATAALAIIAANSPADDIYEAFLNVPFTIGFGDGAILSKPLLLWINDGLMAIFFFLVGLEIKREVVEGELSSRAKAMLPLVAAAGGMIVPALIYVAVTGADPATISGWAIPAATDIAFALGVLALLGSRVPVSLKILLMALAIFDDLGAIVIIALFYTQGLSFTALGVGALSIIGLFLCNRLGVRSVTPYALIGIVLWVAVLKSGVHATLAGVVVALFIPLNKDDKGFSPLLNLEHSLHPWVAFAVLPIFAFANAGVPLEGLTLSAAIEPVPLGIALGLFLGKQMGVFGFSFIAVKLGLSRLPDGANWLQMYGVALLAGIGFTMSLFIGSLAFGGDIAMETGVRIGVICGSIVSAIAGYLILRFACASKAAS